METVGMDSGCLHNENDNDVFGQIRENITTGLFQQIQSNCCKWTPPKDISPAPFSLLFLHLPVLMHIPSFPSTRSLENIHVANSQILLVAFVSIALFALLRTLLIVAYWLRSTDKKAVLQASQLYNEKTPSHSEKETREGNGVKATSWKWVNGFGFGLQLESFPIALNSTHHLGLSPPALGSGAGVLNSKMVATALPSQASPTVTESHRNGTQTPRLIQPKLAKSWYMQQHAKHLRNQAASANAAARRNQPAFETPLPAVYQSVVPVSMAKMIMSRHTFRRPNPGSSRRAPLLPSKRHDVILSDESDRETFHQTEAQSAVQQGDSTADSENRSLQRGVSTTSMV